MYKLLIISVLGNIEVEAFCYRVFTPIALVIFILLLYTITSQLNLGK